MKWGNGTTAFALTVRVAGVATPLEAVETMMDHQTRFGGGRRVVALLLVLLVGTVSWAGAASTAATSALMTALMQDPTSPVDPAPPPPAETRIRTRPAPTVQENVDRAIAAAVGGGTGDGGAGDGGAGDGGTGGGGGFQAGGAAVSVPVEQIFTNTAPTDVFRATSSDETVVTVTVTENPRVVITPVGPGTATVTVSAQRPGGPAAIRTSFDVTVGAPGVPALPLVATGVLGMLLFGAGLYRRWRRA